jgi:hypothetical protein
MLIKRRTITVGFKCNIWEYALTLSHGAGIRALPNDNGASFTNGMNSAILRYTGAPSAEPTTSAKSTNPLVETNLHVRFCLVTNY